jgi:hypothetical protein
MRRMSGIVAFQLKRARATEIPSRLGFCEVCREKGHVRYFVAAKLPRFMHLCDEHYLKVRGKLEKALKGILREEGLLH